jgi:hypothetical protein
MNAKFKFIGAGGELLVFDPAIASTVQYPAIAADFAGPDRFDPHPNLKLGTITGGRSAKRSKLSLATSTGNWVMVEAMPAGVSPVSSHPKVEPNSTCADKRVALT